MVHFYLYFFVALPPQRAPLAPSGSVNAEYLLVTTYSIASSPIDRFYNSTEVWTLHAELLKG